MAMQTITISGSTHPLSTNKIMSIKEWRSITKQGLKESKELVERLIDGKAASYCFDNQLVTYDYLHTEFTSGGFVVDDNQTMPARNTLHSLSGRWLELTREAIQQDQPDLAVDMIDVYLKHFEI